METTEMTLLKELRKQSNLIYRHRYVGDVLHGLQEGYYDDGNLRYKQNCINGVLHGLQEAWYPRKDSEFNYNIETTNLPQPPIGFPNKNQIPKISSLPKDTFRVTVQEFAYLPEDEVSRLATQIGLVIPADLKESVFLYLERIFYTGFTENYGIGNLYLPSSRKVNSCFIDPGYDVLLLYVYRGDCIGYLYFQNGKVAWYLYFGKDSLQYIDYENNREISFYHNEKDGKEDLVIETVAQRFAHIDGYSIRYDKTYTQYSLYVGGYLATVSEAKFREFQDLVRRYKINMSKEALSKLTPQPQALDELSSVIASYL